MKLFRMTLLRQILIITIVSLLEATAFCAAPPPREMPATTVDIPDIITPKIEHKSPWFLRLESSADAAKLATYGAGLSVGYLSKHFFFDLTYAYYLSKYGSIRVYQKGVSDAAPLDPNSEIGRPRADGDTGVIQTIGPGVGFIFQLFKSEKWFQMGRVGVSYATFFDNANDLTFRGGMLNVNASMGYHFSDSWVLAPGVAWNLGYLQRATAPSTIENENFLPIQWFSFQLALCFWPK